MTPTYAKCFLLTGLSPYSVPPHSLKESFHYLASCFCYSERRCLLVGGKVGGLLRFTWIRSPSHFIPTYSNLDEVQNWSLRETFKSIKWSTYRVLYCRVPKLLSELKVNLLYGPVGPLLFVYNFSLVYVTFTSIIV